MSIACAVYHETLCMIVLKSYTVYLRVDVLSQHITLYMKGLANCYYRPFFFLEILMGKLHDN